MVRPSDKRYEFLQARIRETGQLEPFNFSHVEERVAAPSIDSARRLRLQDAELLQNVLPQVLRVYASKCLPILLAMENLEVGYISRFLHVKQLLWVTALDGLFTSGEWEHRGA